MRRDIWYPPSDDEKIEDEDTVPEDEPIDINAPTDIRFAQYHPNITFFDMKEAIRYQIEKELED